MLNDAEIMLLSLGILSSNYLTYSDIIYNELFSINHISITTIIWNNNKEFLKKVLSLLQTLIWNLMEVQKETAGVTSWRFPSETPSLFVTSRSPVSKALNSRLISALPLRPKSHRGRRHVVDYVPAWGYASVNLFQVSFSYYRKYFKLIYEIFPIQLCPGGSHNPGRILW